MKKSEPPSHAQPDGFEDILGRNPFTSTKIIPRSPPQKSAIKPSIESHEVPAAPPPPPLFLFPLSPLPPARSHEPMAPQSSQWTVSKKEVVERRALRVLQHNTVPPAPLPHQDPSSSSILPITASAKGKGMGLFFSGSRNKMDNVENEIERQMEEEREEDDRQRAMSSPSSLPMPSHSDKGESRGWPGWLLDQTNANASAVSSVHGLEASDDFQAWVRSKKGLMGVEGRSAQMGLLHIQTPTRKIEAFKALRHADPDSFKSLMSRPEVIDCDTISPTRTLLTLEYLVSTTISLATFIYAASPLISPQATQGLSSLSASLHFLPFIVWTWSQLNAWSAGHTSVIGSLIGHYLVRQDANYPLHFHTVGLVQCIFTAIVEIVFLGSTLFFGGLLFTLIKLLVLPPWICSVSEGDALRSWRSVGQASMGMIVIRQINKKSSISPFPLSSSSLAPTSNMMTPLPDPQAMRGEGRTSSRVLHGSGWMARRVGEDAVGMTPAGPPRSTFSWGTMYERRN